MLFERKNTQKTEEDIIVKSHAYDALMEYGITSLPVTVTDYRMKNIYIFSWQQYFRVHGQPAHSNITKQEGAIMCLGLNTNIRYVIFYDGNLSAESKRWVIAKLLYYIRCGFAEEHKGEYILSNELSKATEFANHFTCPDIILETCNISSAKDIIQYCQVPFSVAERKTKYLNSGYKKFIFSSLEKLVKDKFEVYIKDFYNKNK